MPSHNSAPPVRANTAKPKDVNLEVKGNDVHLTVDTRRYRIRGLEKNMSGHQLRVNILATRDDLVFLWGHSLGSDPVYGFHPIGNPVG